MIRRIALAAAAMMLVSAPVFAQDWNGDDDGYYSDSDVDVPPAPPEESEGPSFDDFRNDSELSWSGEWVDNSEYGTVWRPTHVTSDWRPYAYGHWSYTDYGWTWVSDEPFGWATYHYGRWAFSDDFGWVWVPGRVWAPAWVAWRWDEGAVGWCPLGPRGFVYQRPAQWVFVETRYILEPVPHHAMPIQLAEPWLRRAHAGPVRRGPHAGPPRRLVEHAVGREVRPLPVVDATGPRGVVPSSSQVMIYRPHSAGRPLARPAEPGGAGPLGGAPSQGGGDWHRRGQGGGGQPVQSPHPRGGPASGGPRAGPGAGATGGGPGSGGPRSAPGAGATGGGSSSGGPHVVPGGGRPHAKTPPEQSPHPRSSDDENGKPHVRH